MDITKAVILGIIQGITEFLPISSTGHLALFGQDEAGFGLYEVVVLHMGTLLAIVVYYRREIREVLFGGVRLLGAFGTAAVGRQTVTDFLKVDAQARLALLIVLGSIPTGIIGLGLKELVEDSLGSGGLKVIGAMFLVTAVLMYIADRFQNCTKKLDEVTPRDAIVVGIFQGLAAMPGLSRSGSTIFGGLLRGVDRTDAAKLSFLMSIPALFGAMLVEMKDAGTSSTTPMVGLIGGTVACIVGYIFLALLIKALASRRLSIFSGYLFVMGLYTLILR